MSSVGVNPPHTPVTKGSNGVAMATLPNVCKMPGPPAPFVPTPLPNIGRSSDGPDGYSTSVKIEGEAVLLYDGGFIFRATGLVAGMFRNRNTVEAIQVAGNRLWIYLQMWLGRWIVDIGPQAGRPPSPYYGAEGECTKNYQNLIHWWQP